MSKLQDVTASGVRAILGGRVTAPCGLAINAASAATVKTTSAITFLNDGIFTSKTALSAQVLTFVAGMNAEVPQGYVQPVSTTVYYLMVVNASGVVRCVQGSYAGQVLRNGEQKLPGGLPTYADGWSPFGLIKVVTNGATTFTPGTDALDKAGCTFTFYDLCALPSVAP